MSLMNIMLQCCLTSFHHDSMHWCGNPWGWLREGALIAMTWAGVLRVGEALAAARSDLILRRDAARELLELCYKLGSQRQEAEPPGISRRA
jgi:hypothetical protein